VKNNQIVDTIYGPMIVNRHATEFDPLAKIGKPGDNEAIELYAALIACMGEGQLILDIGACFGSFSLGWVRLLSRFRPKFIAFEPQPWLFNCIAGTMALNDIDSVMVLNMAIGKECGEAHVPRLDYSRPASFGSLGLMESGEHRWDYLKQDPPPTESFPVEMIAVDAMHARPSVMKIDCEGMELDVLMGAENTVALARPLIFAEYIKGDRLAMRHWFVDHDYEVHYNQCDFVCIPKEKSEQFPKLEDNFSEVNFDE
jgi:FkbM family methyltransferase